MFTNFFTTAWRNVIRQGALTVINVLGLSIGLTCCLVLVIFARYETSFDQQHPYARRTYKVVQQFKSPEQTLFWNTTAYPLAEALRNDFKKIPLVTQASGPAIRPFSIVNEKGLVDRFEDQVLFVDTVYAKVFELGWLAGNPKTALTQPNSIVLTEHVAKRCFGMLNDYAGVLGKSIVLNKDALTITGIVKDVSGNSSLQYSILVPYEFYRLNNPYPTSNWSGNYQGTTFMVLEHDDNTLQLEREIARWQKKYLKAEDDARIVYKLQPLTKIHNDAKYGTSPGSYLMPVRNVHAAYAVALFLLIIASVNFVNLTTAQAATRAKEVGVRKVMGSTRLVLIRQFIFENSLLILGTLVVSIALTSLVLELLNAGLSAIHLSLRLSWFDLMIAGAIGILVVGLAAVYPAIVLSAFSPVESLKNRTLTQSRGGSLRRTLIVTQFTIVQLFVIATIVVWQQMEYFQSKDLGFESQSIIKMEAASPSATALKQQLLQQPGIDGVSFGSGPPLSVDGYSLGTSFRLASQPETEGQEAEMKGIDTTYLSFFNIQLVAGRNITTIRHPFDEFVINEKAAQAMGWTPEDAIGRKLMINEGEATVVGVAKDFHNTALQEDIMPCIMTNWAAFQQQAFVKLNVSRGQTASVLGSVEKVWRELYPEGIYKYSFLTDAMQREYMLERLVLNGFSIFSLLSIVIGAMGLLGMISFMTARKSKEVGIRKVLGANVQQIVVLFSKEFVWMVVVAFLIASPVVYMGMSRWLQDFAYRIALSWWMFALGGGLALLIAMVTVFFQSVKAAIANPVDSLRSE